VCEIVNNTFIEHVLMQLFSLLLIMNALLVSDERLNSGTSVFEILARSLCVSIRYAMCITISSPLKTFYSTLCNGSMKKRGH
jgi:hypothetical protein